jgi:D-3-phosphoglycerate dehydrogenase
VGELVEEPVAQTALAERVRDFDVLIVRLGLRVTREVLGAADRLCAIVSATTGLDHIDLGAAAERGVTVLSLNGEREFLRSVPATAEHTWALLLALVRRLPDAVGHVRDGGWDRDRYRGRDLAGRRLGILGLGRIGERVARYGGAFGMMVGAHDPHRAEWVDGVQRFGTLEDLLRWAEVLTIHVPLTDATRGLLDARRLALLPPGALLINTARGALVDESALVCALERGALGGAALDVLAAEQPPAARAASPVLAYAAAHETLLVTPHIAGATWDSMTRTEVFMAEKLRRFVAARMGVPA